MSAPRGLSQDEATAWQELARTVTPLATARPPKPANVPAVARHADHPLKNHAPAPSVGVNGPSDFARLLERPVRTTAQKAPAVYKAAPAPTRQGNLDSHWDRRIKSGAIQPDFSLDLHGATLDGAWHRLDAGLTQARAMGARVVLLVTGKPRPVAPADRGSQRGAIRAKVLDWLAAGPHGSCIAAIRKAHPRHGGDGALYLVLRKGI